METSAELLYLLKEFDSKDAFVSKMALSAVSVFSGCSSGMAAWGQMFKELSHG